MNLQGKLHPAKSWASLAAVHQELHNIIAMAGYLAICMSWSPSIFRVVFPRAWRQLGPRPEPSGRKRLREVPRGCRPVRRDSPRPAAHYDEDEG